MYTVTISAMYVGEFEIEAKDEEEAQLKAEEYLKNNKPPLEYLKGSLQIDEIFKEG